MKYYFLFGLLVLISKQEIIKEEEVLVIDNSNYEETIKKFSPIMLEFYAPWCGHCKEFAPHYKKAAEILKTHSIYLAKIDATVNAGLAMLYDIKSYPTVFFLVNGEKIEFNGQRDTDVLVKWCLTHSLPVANYVKVKRKFEQFRQDFDTIVAYFPKGDKMERDQRILEEIAKNKRLEFLLIIVQGESLKSKLGVEKNHHIVLFSGREQTPFEGVLSPQQPYFVNYYYQITARQKSNYKDKQNLYLVNQIRKINK